MPPTLISYFLSWNEVLDTHFNVFDITQTSKDTGEGENKRELNNRTIPGFWPVQLW